MMAGGGGGASTGGVLPHSGQVVSWLGRCLAIHLAAEEKSYEEQRHAGSETDLS